MAHLEWDSQTCAQCSCYEFAQSSLEYSPPVRLARHWSEPSPGTRDAQAWCTDHGKLTARRERVMTGFRLWGESQAPAGSLQSVPVRAYAHETEVVCRARRERSWPRPDSLGAVLGLGVVLACRVHEHISQKCLTQQAKPITHWSESLALRKLSV